MPPSRFSSFVKIVADYQSPFLIKADKIEFVSAKIIKVIKNLRSWNLPGRGRSEIGKSEIKK
jgi:hypothetical protein